MLMRRTGVQAFQEALKEHEEQLVKDPVVHTHLSALYDTLLEQNLIRLIEPFSCVQIQHLAELISLPLDTVLNKLAQVLYPTLQCIARVDRMFSKRLSCLLQAAFAYAIPHDVPAATKSVSADDPGQKVCWYPGSRSRLPGCL